MTSLSERQQLGRAKNAVSTYLARRLVVPKIFLDAEWSQQPVDLLAIDRAGVGDVHAVCLISREPIFSDKEAESARTISKAHEALEQIRSLSCQYKYVAIVSNFTYQLQMGVAAQFKQDTFAEDGVGRVGILYVDVSRDNLIVDEIVKAERFRSSKQILDLTDKYVATHTADMEYREPADDGVHA